MSLPESAPAQVPTMVRTLALAFILAPIVVFIAVDYTMEGSWLNAPEPVLIVALCAAVAVSYLLSESLGFRTSPLSASTQPSIAAIQRQSIARYMNTMMTRIAITELPILASVALTFALDYGMWPLAITMLFALPSMWIQVWPSRRNVYKVAEALEAEGVRSWLPEVFEMA